MPIYKTGNILHYFQDLDNRNFQEIQRSQIYEEKEKLERLFNDSSDTVFIPAGRNLITLLSSQLNYIFTTLEEPQLRNIDYVTRKYTEYILKIKPSFREGLEGLRERYLDFADLDGGKTRNKQTIHLLIKQAKEILNGTYRCADGEDRLYINDGSYVKINFASSGQQEIVWVLNLLLYCHLYNKKTFLILEEPETHLYPETQRLVAEMLSVFRGEEENSMLITTHSPYILGSFNNMLLAGQLVEPTTEEPVKKLLHKKTWLKPDGFLAYHVQKGSIKDALDRDGNLTLINNYLIDGAAEKINSINDAILSAQAVAGPENNKMEKNK